LMMNLQKLLELLFALFTGWIQHLLGLGVTKSGHSEITGFCPAAA
jgi:hypothetical protein